MRDAFADVQYTLRGNPYQLHNRTSAESSLTRSTTNKLGGFENKWEDKVASRKQASDLNSAAVKKRRANEAVGGLTDGDVMAVKDSVSKSKAGRDRQQVRHDICSERQYILTLIQLVCGRGNV